MFKRSFIFRNISQSEKITRIYTWGNGSDGRLGNGDVKNISIPTQVSYLKNISQIACGDSHMMALTKNGSVYSWGKGSSGQLGVNDWDDYLEPCKISLPKIKYIACGDFSSAAVTEDGDLYTWGWGGRILNWAPIGMGTLGLESTKNINVPTKVESLKGVKMVSVGKRHSACITEDGKTFIWGRGEWGRLGIGSNASRKLPFELENIAFQSSKVSVASNFSGAISTENDIYMWGKNDRNQLGFESTGLLVGGNQFDGVTLPTYLDVSNDKGKEVKFKDLALGESLCAAASVEGDGYMWGGALQTPTRKDDLKNIVSVAGGSNHIAYVSGEGELFAVGSNWNNQLGISGKKVQSQDVVKVPIDKYVLSVACGSNFTAAIVYE